MQLEDLLLPDIPASTRNAYLGLSARAEVVDFGPLEDGVIVLDTETTGLSFRDCELIEIAAARLEGRAVVGRYHTFVNPGQPIPPEIARLTNIRDVDVADAPTPREAVAGLSDFVGGMPVIAHNATFDRTFIQKAAGGSSVSDLWIDSLALSRIALPCLRTHRLSDMATAFGCDGVTHRAMDDVDALCGMWRIILLGLSDLPSGLLSLLAGMHPEVDWPYRPVFSHIANMGSTEPFSLRDMRLRLGMEASGGHGPKRDAADAASPPTAPAPEEIEAAFKPGGVVSSLYERYEQRPDQLHMAQEVARALGTSTHRAIEAGTGVGKSMAYLLPEALLAKRNNVTVGVATKTNALADQLVTQELPALDRALPGGVSFAGLKGYEHYLCLHRLELATALDLPTQAACDGGRSMRTVRSDMLTALAVSYAYACQMVHGDLDALGIRWRNVPRSMLTVRATECLRAMCPFFPKECFVHAARRRAAACDVVVTNHALLLCNVDMEGKILPPIRHWVVDEAHGFEQEARRQWAHEVSGEAVRRGFETLGTTRAGIIHTLMGEASSLEGSALLLRLLTKTSSCAARASVSMGEFFLHLHDLSGLVTGGGYETLTLWVDGAVRKSGEWRVLYEAFKAVEQRLCELAKDIGEAQEAIGGSSAKLATDLGEAGRFSTELLDTMRLIMEGTDESYVYSAELSRARRAVGVERLVAEKLDIGADLAERWLPEMESVVFTSATMAVGESFAHFDHAVGLDRLPASEHGDVRLGSSFDFGDHMSVVIARDMPQPNDAHYLERLEGLLFDVHVAMGGSTLTLFTNRRDMERLYGTLQARLAREGIDLLCQNRGASPRRLREQFMAHTSTSLFALRSFWEGFDAGGDTLRCVVIPKLPFASPQDPLVRERELREDRSWWRHSLPEAVISVKQASGRLIRSATDTGVLVLADSRLVSKRYGRQFTSSLPNPDAMQVECDNVGRLIRLWRSSRER